MRSAHLFCILIFFVCSVSGEKALVILGKDEMPHLVSKTGSKAYHYGPNNKNQIYIDIARTVLMDYSYFLPGLISIESQDLTLTTYTDSSGDLSDSFEAEVEVVIRSNRDFKDAYLIAHWRKPNGDHTKIACAIGDLKAGQKRNLSYRLPVHKSFEHSTYKLFFMAGGVQIMSSSSDISEYVLSPIDEYKKEHGSDLKDGGPAPISTILPKHILYKNLLDRHAAGEVGNIPSPIPVITTINKDGYVIKMEIEEKDLSDDLLAEYALETIQLWKFKPRIKNGEPVESKVTIPFAFDPGTAKK